MTIMKPLLLLLCLLPLGAKAQCDFITPNFGATYTEQEQMLDEQIDEAKKKGEFHATVEAGVSASFGKHNPYAGAMFYTGINGTYFRRVTEKLTLAAGFDLYNYAGTTDATTLGLHAMAHYQFNDRMDGSIYIEHNFGNLRSGYTPYNPMLRYGMGYGLYDGGLFGLGRYDTFSPSTTVAGRLGWNTKRGGRIELGVSFTHIDRTNTPFGLRRHDFVGGMPTFY